MIIGLNLLCFGWFCLILLCPLVWLICSLKTQIFNLPRVVKFLASNLRQFQVGKINFTAKSTKFKRNLTNKLCVFCARFCCFCGFAWFCWLVGCFCAPFDPNSFMIFLLKYSFSTLLRFCSCLFALPQICLAFMLFYV